MIRPMKLFYSLTAALGVLLVSSNASADPHCEKVDEVLRSVGESSSDAQRITVMQALLGDLGELVAPGFHGDFPPSFLRHCISVKESSFDLSAAKVAAKSTLSYRLLMGRYLDLRGKPEAAYAYYQEAAQARPPDASAQVRAFQLWQELRAARWLANPQSVEAPSGFINALTENPGLAEKKVEVLGEWALRLEKSKRPLEAVEIWRKTLQLDPKNLVALTKIALFHYEHGDKEAARLELEQIDAENPNRALVTRYLAEMDLDDGKPAAAAARIKKTLIAHPGDKDLQRLQARAWGESGRAEEGLALAESLLKNSPADSESRAVVAQLRLQEGEALERKSDATGALKLYVGALELQPLNSALRYKIAGMLFSYQEERHFQPEASAKKDMSEALKILTPLLDSDYVEPSQASLGLRIARHSEHTPSVKHLCTLVKGDDSLRATLSHEDVESVCGSSAAH